MAILKIKKRKDLFVQIDKKTLEDKNLSFKATGLLAYLMGRPEDWKIIPSHLEKCKTDGLSSIKSALLELRRNDYCHYFEVREKGVVKETFYYVFEIPTPYSDGMLMEILEQFKDTSEPVTVNYKAAKTKSENTTPEIKEQDNQVNPENLFSSQPETEKPLVDNPLADKPLTEKPLTENHPLLIIDSTNNRVSNKRDTKERITNNRTTTKETNKESSSTLYSFLDEDKYPKINEATIKNIRNNIQNLTEDRFKTLYLLTEEYVLSGKGYNFNAILYKALKNEWSFKAPVRKETESVLSEDKRKWLSRYSGITTNKSLKKEIEGIICEIPIEELRKNRSVLSSMDTFQFKMFLISLKSRCRAMRG